MNNEEFEEFVRRNPEEALRLIVKAFKPRELLKIGDRSYVNAFKYPESRFDPKDLLPDGGSLQVLKGDMLQPLRDPSKTFTDQVVTGPSYIIWQDGTTVYAKNGRTGQIEFSGTDAGTVIQNAIDTVYGNGGGKVFIKSGTYNITPKLVYSGWYIGLLLKSNVALEGEHPAATKLMIKPVDLSVRTDGIGVGVAENGSYVLIENFAIRNLTVDLGMTPQTSSPPYGSCIRGSGNGGKNALLENLILQNSNEFGIAFSGGSAGFKQFIMRNLRAVNHQRGAFWFALTDDLVIDGVYCDGVVGNLSTGEGFAVYIESGMGIFVRNVYGLNLPFAIVALSSGTYAMVDGVHGNTDGHGITISDGWGFKISNVNIWQKTNRKSGTYGIYIVASTYSPEKIYIDKAIINNFEYGVYCKGSSSYHVKDVELSEVCLSGSLINVKLEYTDYFLYADSRVDYYWDMITADAYSKYVLENIVGYDTKNFKSTGVSVTVGTNGAYGSASAITSPSGVITYPRVKITWGGTFGTGETVTVKVEAVYSDTTAYIEKSATATGSLWLSDDDILSLIRRNRDIVKLNIYAKTNLSSTTVTVTVDAYGKA